METSGLDHVVLSVSDVQRSHRFYQDILGFEVNCTPDDYANRIYAGSCTFMVGAVEITLISHDQTPTADRFSEFRIGLDHLSFKAPDETALHTLADRLQQAGVETNGVETYMPSGKHYVVFRDPDNIQLEYWLTTPDQHIQREE